MVELRPEQINKLYEFIGKNPPGEVTEQDVSQVLVEIEKKYTPFYCKENENKEFENNKNILVVDDLEVSLFQLTTLFSKSGYNSLIARTSCEAIDIYKKNNFDYVFLDLFLPEPEDGISLLEKFKELEKTTKNNTKIIVISGSDDKKLINECFVKGAHDYVRKSQNWHKSILEKLRHFDEIKRGPASEIKTTIEDEENKIASIKIKNILKPSVIDDLKREVLNLANSGYSHLLFDMANVNNAHPEILNILVFIFKTCDKNNGSLKLYNVSSIISESLSYVFLDGVIPIHTNKDSALVDFYKENNKSLSD